MDYLRNAWYAAAWSDEVAPERGLGRTIMDEPVAIFRTADGAVAAVLDQCPHRFAPFSAGRVKDNILTCGHPGLGFDGGGRCVLNPHGPAPRNGAVKSCPTAEACKAVWIWMGAAAHADPTLLAAIIGDLPERADAYQRVRWFAPSVMKLIAGVAPTGATEDEGAFFVEPIGRRNINECC